MKLFLLSVLSTAVLASPTPAAAPGGFKVAKVIYGGSGCPQGSLDVDITSDGKILPITYGKDFAASIGPNTDASQSRKNCQLNLDLRFNPGFQYSVLSADYEGFAKLDQGVTGRVKSTYYFSGEQNQVSNSLTFNGPVTGHYLKHDEVEIAVWSPCGSGALLNINTDVALTQTSASAKGLLTANESSAKFTQSVYIKWREC